MPTLKKSPRRPWMARREPFEGFAHHNAEFYQSRRWRSLRALKLKEQPLCEECLRQSRITAAQMIDHIVPINKGGAPLDMDNLQSLCNACHARKSARDK